jgi:TATA-binding protein-associated factor Taf7
MVGADSAEREDDDDDEDGDDEDEEDEEDEDVRRASSLRDDLGNTLASCIEEIKNVCNSMSVAL